VDQISHGELHHIELWVPNLDRAEATWGWLLTELGYDLFQDWADGKSWRSGSTYIVVEQSSARIGSRHDRCRPGLNHLAFHVESRVAVDKLVAEAPQHGWRLMFTDRHPFAGGQAHYAAYLESVDGFEVELVALPEPPPAEPEPGAETQAAAAPAGPERESGPGSAAPSSGGPEPEPGPAPAADSSA
jgi:catechol 2,3-dioxygenase-like lactoylglutathione lyase family enzyme